MKVLLLFPPFWDTQQPYLALPSLTAFLQTEGVAVSQRDLNIEIFDYLLSSTYLKKIGPRIEKQIKLGSKKNLSQLKKARSLLPEVVSEIGKAKKVLRDENSFYDLKLFQQSKRLLQSGLFIISSLYFPTKLDLFGYFSSYSTDSPVDLLKASVDRKSNLFLEIYEELIPPIIKKEKPVVIGISISGEYQIIPGLTLARFIKKNYPKVHLVIGGNIFTRLGNVLSQRKKFFSIFFNSVIMHEGEKPLLSLVTALTKKKGLNDVPNLLYFKKGKIMINKIGLPEDLNRLPTPDFTGLKLSLYFTPTPILPVLASRGCYWGKCAFCDHGYIYRRYYRTRRTDLLVNDLKTLRQKYQTKYFSFADEAISPKQYRLISETLIKERVNIYWLSEARFEKEISKKLARKIYKAGGLLIYFGLESASQRILSLMKKGTKLETIKKVLENTAKAGIWNHVFVFFGFPTETKKEAKKTSNFIFNHKETIHSVWSGVFAMGRWSGVRQNPQQFKISKIKEKKFSLSYDYKPLAGCSLVETKKIWERFKLQLDQEYGKPIWRVLNRAELLLYLDHYKDRLGQLDYKKRCPKDLFSIIYQ